MSPARPVHPRADEISLPIDQPEQTLAAEPAPVAPIPPAVARLPEGDYALALPTDSREAHFAELPLMLARAADAAAAPITARLKVLAPEQAAQLSPAGVAFTLAISQTGATETAVYLVLDYGQLNLPTYGASFAERLTLYRGLGCQAETGTMTCRAFVPLPGVNDAVNDRLTVALDEQALLQRLQSTSESPAADAMSAGQPGKEGVNPESENGSAKESDAVTAVAPPPPTGETAADWLVADLQSLQPAVYVLAASASGDQGDFAATPFTGNSDYQLSLAVGAMQTSYAVPLPPAAGGLAPDVTLAYDSGSVDGMTLNKNNQPGWVGIGWHYEPGSITRRLKTCGLTQAPGDLCLTGDNYVLALNGVSSPLVSLTSYHPFYGYVETETNGVGHITSYVRDPGWGDETSITDPNGRVTTLQYDAFGRLTKVWQPSEPTSGPPSEEFVYDIEAQPASILDRELVEVSWGAYLENWTYYDGFAREIQTQRPGTAAGQRVVTSQQYDADGELAYESSAYEISGAAGSGYVAPDWQTLANYQYTQYDELARPTRVETRSGTSTLWVERTSYDGWLQSAFDANDHRTDSYLNAFGKTWRVVEYNDVSIYTTDYAFDARDNLVSVTDALSHTITLSYDLLGRKTGMTDPDMDVWQYSYDGGDNLTAQRDGRGQWLYFEYDAADRLVRKRQDTVAGPVLAEWLYDAPGQLSLLSKTVAYTSEGAVEVRNLVYDLRNRNTEKEWVIPGPGGGVFRFAYGFNEADQQTWVRYPGGNAGQPGELVAKHYNGAGQLDQVASDDGTQYVASTLYNAQGQIIEQRLDAAPNGLTRQYVYDPGTLRLSVLRAGVTSPFEELQKLNFSYDNVGNVTSITDGNNSDQKQCFRYDTLDRLTFAFTGTADCVAYSNVGSGAYSHTYAYDAIGNITSYNGSAYTYGSQPHAVTAAFSNSYGYDANGNQTGRTVGSVSYTFDFDYENRLSAVRQGETVAGSFLYDADGDRVKGAVNGVTTVYLDGIYEYQGGATTKYYDGGAIRRSGYPGDNGIAYNLTDHLQSTSVLVNRDGTLNGRNLFFPYGGNRGAALNPLTTKRFTGQYHEPSLLGGEGLYFFNARWYDAQLGRFLSADPLVPEPGRPQALNRYAYTLNNPLKYTDPTGHFWWIAAAGAVGAVIGAGSVALPQMIQNVRTHQPLTANISAAAVGKAAAAGFVAGAVGAATFGAGTAVMGGGFAATVGAGMISGVTAGQAGRAADNVVNRRAITSGLAMCATWAATPSQVA